MKSKVRFGTALLVVWLAASAIRSDSKIPDLSKIHICTELFKDGSSHPPQVKGTGAPACLWHKRTLTVTFLEGDPEVQRKVQQHAVEWTQYSGITFQFGDFAGADIRIKFAQSGPKSGSWSYVGTCQPNSLGPADATMNFGWLTPTTSDQEYQRVVLHEFGHALGLQHEHQNPGATIHWSEEAVYEYYGRTQGWDREKIRENILNKLHEDETIHGQYDPDSIMEYPIPKELTLDGFEVGWNRELSPEDKTFIHKLYSANTTPAPFHAVFSWKATLQRERVSDIAAVEAAKVKAHAMATTANRTN